MDTVEIIRKLCKERGVPVSQVENDLGYGNGSISKSKNMSADRAYQIAKYFGVSVEYLMTGKEVDEINDEMSLLRQQQSILLEISKLSQEITKLYKNIDIMQSNIVSLQQEYSQIEAQKNQLFKKDLVEEKSQPQPQPQPQPLVKKITPTVYDDTFHFPGFAFGGESSFPDETDNQFPSF
jgi:transcriptional regulator with XRE-family HTH domain